MYGHMGGLWGGGLMWILWIVVLAVAALLIYRLARPGGPSRTRDDSAETILKQRYARGEIDKNTYEKTLSDLRR